MKNDQGKVMAVSDMELDEKARLLKRVLNLAFALGNVKIIIRSTYALQSK